MTALAIRWHAPTHLWYNVRIMTKLLEEGIKAIRSLPKARQDATGELLLNIAGQGDGARYHLTEDQVAEVHTAMGEADRGEFVSEATMAAFWRKCGL